MRKPTKRIACARALICCLACLGLLACGGPVEHKTEEVIDAVQQTSDDLNASDEIPVYLATAELMSPGDSLARGTVTFTQERGQVTVRAELEGVLPPGPHGLHIHEFGDCSAADFSSAGGHFNPMNTQHGCPSSEERHAGDLGNIVISDDGTGILELATDLITVTEGPLSVVGRAVILHAGEDDCTSQPSGAAGDRMVCGRIVLASSEKAPEEASSPTTEQ